MTEQIKPRKKIIEFRRPFVITELYGPEQYLDNEFDLVFAENSDWGAIDKALNSGNSYSDMLSGRLIADLPFRYEEKKLNTNSSLPIILTRANNLGLNFMPYFQITMNHKFHKFSIWEPVPKLKKTVYDFYFIVASLHEK